MSVTHSEGHKAQSTAIRPAIFTDYVELVAVSALWGSAFLCNAWALVDFTPLEIAAWRLSLAGVGLWTIMRLMGLHLPRDRGSLGLLIGIGALNGAIPFLLIGWGQQEVASSTTGILIATSPFATLVISHFSRAGENFTTARVLGLALGFIGVVVLFGDGIGGSEPVRMGAICIAATCYAWSAVLIRKLVGIPNLVIVTGTVISASLLLLPALLWFSPPWQASASTPAILAVLFLALGPTGIAYFVRTRLVQRNGPVFMSAAGYLIPLFAVLWGWIFLGERPGLGTLLALILILGGIAVSQWHSYNRIPLVNSR